MGLMLGDKAAETLQAVYALPTGFMRRISSAASKGSDSAQAKGRDSSETPHVRSGLLGGLATWTTTGLSAVSSAGTLSRSFFSALSSNSARAQSNLPTPQTSQSQQSHRHLAPAPQDRVLLDHNPSLPSPGPSNARMDSHNQPNTHTASTPTSHTASTPASHTASLIPARANPVLKQLHHSQPHASHSSSPVTQEQPPSTHTHSTQLREASAQSHSKHTPPHHHDQPHSVPTSLHPQSNPYTPSHATVRLASTTPHSQLSQSSQSSQAPFARPPGPPPPSVSMRPPPPPSTPPSSAPSPTQSALSPLLSPWLGQASLSPSSSPWLRFMSSPVSVSPTTPLSPAAKPSSVPLSPKYPPCVNPPSVDDAAALGVAGSRSVNPECAAGASDVHDASVARNSVHPGCAADGSDIHSASRSSANPGCAAGGSIARSSDTHQEKRGCATVEPNDMSTCPPGTLNTAGAVGPADVHGASGVHCVPAPTILGAASGNNEGLTAP
eukprot:Rmarinus@m.8427